MLVVLELIGLFMAFCIFPFAVIFGSILFYIFGFFGAVVGVLGGLFVQMICE